MEQELRFGLDLCVWQYWKKKGLGQVWATFEDTFFLLSGAKKCQKCFKNIVAASASKSCIKWSWKNISFLLENLRFFFNCVLLQCSPRDLSIMTLLDKEHYCCRVCELITTSFHEFQLWIVFTIFKDFECHSNCFDKKTTKQTRFVWFSFMEIRNFGSENA